MSDIDVISAPPSRAFTDPAAWSAEMHAWLSQLGPMAAQYNLANAELVAKLLLSFTGSSTDSITIGTGTKVMDISPGMALVEGHKLSVAATLSPDNLMLGTVEGYDPETGALTLDVTSVEGSGTFDQWSIGLASVADLSAYVAKAGGTMTGALTAPGFISNGPYIQVISGTPTLLLEETDGTAGYEQTVVRRLGDAFEIGTRTDDEFVSGDYKIFFGPTGATVHTFRIGNIEKLRLVESGLELTGAVKEDIFTVTDGPSVSINPADGSIQKWTLGANRTPTLSLITAGKTVTLLIDDGSAYTLTLSGVTWMNNGLAAPALKTSGLTPITLFHDGSNLLAWLSGDGG